MIPKLKSYTPEQVESLLLFQHIATRAACLVPLISEFDNSEKIYVGEVVNALNRVEFESVRIDKKDHHYQLDKRPTP